MEYKLNQAQMKLEAAEGKIVAMTDRVYQIDKAEALVKYWEKQNYEREAEIKSSISRYDKIIAEKDDVIAEKDQVIVETKEKLDFAKEKIGVLEEKLTKAEDKIVILTKKNEQLSQQMRDLKKACEAQLVAMRKKCERDLKIADLKAKKNLKKVAQFAEKKYAEMIKRCEDRTKNVSDRLTTLRIKSDTWYKDRILYLMKVIDKLKKEASHTYARITAAEDLKQAEIDIDNLENALQKEQEEHKADNIKNEQIIEEKEKKIQELEKRIKHLERELRQTLMAPKEDYERLCPLIYDLQDKYKSKCDDLDRVMETLRLTRKKADEDAEIARYEIKIRDLEIERLGYIIDDQRGEIKRQKVEAEHLKIRISKWRTECERRHRIILSKIKEIGRLEEVIKYMALKAEDDAIAAARILKKTRKVLRETQDHVKRLQIALEEAIDFGRRQTKKVNVALQTIKEKEEEIIKRDKEIVALEQDIRDATEENLNLEWDLNKRKQLDADKNATIDKQRVEIQELRSALEAIERRIRTNNAKMARMKKQMRQADERVLRANQLFETKEKELEDFKIKATAIQDKLKDEAKIRERNLREIIKQKDESYKEFEKKHQKEMKEADFREYKLQDRLDTSNRKRKNANERRRVVEEENAKLVDRLKVAEAEAHAFKLQRLRIEQAEALAKLGKYVGLEAREQTLNNLQRRLNDTRDFLERERALTRETVQELAMRNSTLMVQVKKLASSLKGARTEQAELLSNQLMDVSNYSNHLISKLDESELLELQARGRLPPVDPSKYSSRNNTRRSGRTGDSSRGNERSNGVDGASGGDVAEAGEGGMEERGSSPEGVSPSRRQSRLERLRSSPYKFSVPRVKYTGKRTSSFVAKARPTSWHPLDHKGTTNEGLLTNKRSSDVKEGTQIDEQGEVQPVSEDANEDQSPPLIEEKKPSEEKKPPVEAESSKTET